MTVTRAPRVGGNGGALGLQNQHGKFIGICLFCISSYFKGMSCPNVQRAAYRLPVAGVPAFKMEVAAAKMRAALWLGISFSVFSQCWM
jgi:hypothetical protein